MPKKISNMTDQERIAYWQNHRATARKSRQYRIDKLNDEQRKAIEETHKWLETVLNTALYPDMGGIRMVSAYELQELSDAKDKLSYQFNLIED